MNFSTRAATAAPTRGTLAIATVAVLLALSGCANLGGSGAGTVGSASTAGNGDGIVTASDETDGQKRARIRLQLAVGYFQEGKPLIALDEIKKALSTDPNYADAFNLRGLVYMQLDDAGLAEDSFRRAVALNPRNGDVLHNYGWLMCQQQRYADAKVRFEEALAAPGYSESAKTLMTLGLCDLRAGLKPEAEKHLLQAYELDAGNPIVGYNLALLLAERQDYSRAQFYIRRVNNSQVANAESLWLGIKVERRLSNREIEAQLASRLRRDFPQSREAIAYERGNFNE